MKHITRQDLLVLIKLVNQASDQFSAVEDTALVIRRQDREFKGLPPEDLQEATETTASVSDACRKLRVIRNRLIQELGDADRAASENKAGLTSPG